MNAFDIVRFGVASLATVGAAFGGFAVSQNEGGVTDLPPPLPPSLKDDFAQKSGKDVNLQFANFDSAFAGQAVATQANLIVEAAKWNLVGVIGDSKSARAVFADPADASNTFFASIGDELPDGRVLGKITQSHVFFSAPPSSTGEAGPNSSVALFNRSASPDQAESQTP